MGSNAPHEGFDQEIADLIKQKVKRMFGTHRAYGHHDREDASQESWLRIAVAMRRFDPKHANKRTYASRIIANTLNTLLAHDDAQKRHRRRVAGQPSKDLPDRYDQEQIDMRLDVAAAISELGSDEGAIATLFKTFTVAEIASRTGMSRQQVRGQQKRLAEQLSHLNENPSTANHLARSQYISLEGLIALERTRLMEETTQFVFDHHVSLNDVQGTLRLAQLAAESLHGQSRVELEAACAFDRITRCVSVDAATEVGRTLATVFFGYAKREFGPEAITILRPSRSGSKE